MELVIDSIGKEEDALQILVDCGVEVGVDPDTVNGFLIDELVERGPLEYALDNAGIAYHWEEDDELLLMMEDDDEEDDDDDILELEEEENE